MMKVKSREQSSVVRRTGAEILGSECCLCEDLLEHGAEFRERMLLGVCGFGKLPSFATHGFKFCRMIGCPPDPCCDRLHGTRFNGESDMLCRADRMQL